METKDRHEGSAVERDGYAVVSGVFSGFQVDELRSAVDRIRDLNAVRSRGGTYAIRNLLALSPEVRAAAAARRLRALIGEHAGPQAIPVRAILFDKTPDANWLVPWHQDLTIAVESRVDVDGYGPWSVKAGVVHVQPPVRVLERIVSARIHLDDCGETNGPLRVLPGSHRFGRLSDAAVAEWSGGREAIACVVPKGGVVLMKPLLLHASSAAAVPTHRRVIHIDFAPPHLDGGLRWAAPGF